MKSLGPESHAQNLCKRNLMRKFPLKTILQQVLLIKGHGRRQSLATTGRKAGQHKQYCTLRAVKTITPRHKSQSSYRGDNVDSFRTMD